MYVEQGYQAIAVSSLTLARLLFPILFMEVFLPNKDKREKRGKKAPKSILVTQNYSLTLSSLHVLYEQDDR